MWSESSASVYYESLKQSLMAEPKVKPEDLRPTSVQGLLRRLRIPSDVNPGENSPQVFEMAAQELLRDEGLETTIQRLWGLPIPMPAPVVTAVQDLPKNDRRELIKKLLKVSGSPVSLIHLLYLLTLCSQDTSVYQRLARRLIRNIIYAAGSAEFDAFKAILSWVSDEFGHWQQFQAVPSRLKLALVWSHSHVLFATLTSARAPVDWLRDRFDSMGKHIPHELFHRHPNYWFDITHPRQLNRTNLLLSGLSYSLGEEVTKVIDPHLQDALIAAAYQTVENERLPVASLLRDPTLASDSLNSFLAGDRGQSLLSLVGSETAQAVSRESLLNLTTNAVQNLREQPDNSRSWTIIFAIIGDMPPYAEVVEGLSAVLKQSDLCQILEKDRKLGICLLMAATAWSCNLGDHEVQKHLKEQIIKICRLQSQSASSTPKDEAVLVLLESALNLSRSTETDDNILPEFANLVTGMVEAWSALISDFRPVVQRFVDELPISQARHLYPLLLRLRAA